MLFVVGWWPLFILYYASIVPYGLPFSFSEIFSFSKTTHVSSPDIPPFTSATATTSSVTSMTITSTTIAALETLLRSWSYICEDTIDWTYQSILYVDPHHEENLDLYREAMFHCRQGFHPSALHVSAMRENMAHFRLSLLQVPFPHPRILQSLQERFSVLEQLALEWETSKESFSHDNDNKRMAQRIQVWRQETLRLEQSAFPQTRRFLEWMEQLQKEDIQLHALQDNMRVTDLQDWLYHHDWFPSSTLVLLQTLADKAIASLLQKTWWFLGMCLAFSFVVRQFLRVFLFFFIRKKKEQKLLQ